MLISTRAEEIHLFGPRNSFFCLTILALGVFAYGEQPDYHVTRDPSHSSYLRSAFLHGHRHGYEEGFHAADQDLHLGRQAHPFDKRFRVPKTIGYRSDYGDKKNFRHGYEAGYAAGYSDSYSGRDFNHPPSLIASSDEIAGKAADPAAVKKQSAMFDSGVLEGYRAAAADTAQFELRPGFTKYAEDFCRHNMVPGTSEEFCQGYGKGYVLGKADLSRKIGPETDNAIRVAKNQP